MKKIFVLLLAGCLMFAGCVPEPIPNNPSSSPIPPTSSQDMSEEGSGEASEEGSCVHSYKEELVPPTCIEAGYTSITCELCGHSYKDNLTLPTGHIYNGDGACVVCGYKDAPPEVSEQGCEHSFLIQEEVEPTCKAEGKRVSVCSLCGEELVESIPALPHQNISLSVSPTCTAEGYEGLVCEVCGWRTVYNTIKPKGHKMEVTVIPPTCNEKGFTLERCSECGEERVRDYVEPTGEHSLVKTSVVVPPTSESDGYTEYRCLICGETVKGDIVPKGE